MFEGMLQTLTDLEREEIQMPALEYAYSLLLFYLVRWLEGEQFLLLYFHVTAFRRDTYEMAENGREAYG